MGHQIRQRAGRSAVLLDPHPFCRVAITTLLKEFDTVVAASAATPCAAAMLLEEHRPSLLITELDLPEGREQVLELIRNGVESDPKLAVVALSGTDDDELIDAAFDAGVSAYVLKTAELGDLRAAIAQVLEPSIYLARRRPARAGLVSLDSQLARELPQLTRREREILQLVSEGRSNRQVAQLLWITDQTVKFHLANVYRKLGVGSRFEAAAWARENGVLDVAEAIALSEGTAEADGAGTPLPEPARIHSTRRREFATESVARGTSR